MAPKNPREPTKDEEKKREESSDEEEENSEEESESGETEEEGSSEEEEEEKVIAKPYKPQALVPNSESKSISKSKSKSNSRVSDSEGESDGSPSDYKMQPIAKAAAAKRTHQEKEESLEVSRSSKKAKIGEKEKEREREKEKEKEKEKKNSGSTPGGVIARLWSDEDEIAVLNGMIDFRKEKGHDYNSEEIYNFIKDKLQGDFTKIQLRTKINRMKKRFLNALKKNPDPVFSKPHDDLAFELSKKIWGDATAAAANNGSSVKKDGVKNGNVKKEVVVKGELEEKASAKRDNGDDDDGEEEGEFWSKYPYLSSSFVNMRGSSSSLSISEASVNLLKGNVSLIGDSKAKELNQKWRQLFMEELELNNKKLALMKEQTQLGLNQMSGS